MPELPPDRDGLHGVLPGHLPAVREAPAQMKENITFKRLKKPERERNELVKKVRFRQ